MTNARLATELRIKRWLAEDAGADTVGALRLAIDEAPRLGVDPEALWELAQGLPYAVDIRCEPESADGDIAVLFTRYGSPPVDIDTVVAAPPRPFADCANNPLREKASRAFVPELMRDLKAALPQHMIPASIVMLDSFPLLPNGKVDRQALPPPDFDTLYREQYVAPHTATQQAVQSIWAAVLGVDNPGIHDNFFALGGHSLKVTQVVSRIAQDLKKYRLAAGFLQSSDDRRTCRAAGRSAVGQRGRTRSPQRRPRPTIPFRRRSSGSGSWPRWTAGAAYHMADSPCRARSPRRECRWRAPMECCCSGTRSCAPGSSRSPARCASACIRSSIATFETVDLRGAPVPIEEARRLALADARRGLRSGQRAAGQDCACCAPAAASTCCSSTCITSFRTAGAWTCWSASSMQLYAGRGRGARRLRCRRCASSIATTSPGRTARLRPRMQQLREYWRSELGDLPPATRPAGRLPASGGALRPRRPPAPAIGAGAVCAARGARLRGGR